MATCLSSCFKEDDPVPPYVSPAGVHTVVAEMKPDYSIQSYYDLETNTFVSSNNREDWDFSYSCKAGVSAVYLNSAKKVRVFDTQSADWAVSFTPSGSTDWLYDASTGEPENTALHNRINDNVYIMDLGVTVTGTAIGYKKIKFVSATEQDITLQYADLDGNNIRTLTLSKNADYNFVYYSFKNGGAQVTPEPTKDKYDLLFTFYTSKVYYDNNTAFEWYGVSGVLLNPTGVTVAVDSADKFTSLTYQDLTNYTFSDKRDAIGYDWKTYDINAGVYTILVKNTYMVRDRNGSFWKLRFTSFTNALGEHGYPTFEVGKF